MDDKLIEILNEFNDLWYESSVKSQPDWFLWIYDMVECYRLVCKKKYKLALNQIQKIKTRFKGILVPENELNIFYWEGYIHNKINPNISPDSWILIYSYPNCFIDPIMFSDVKKAIDRRHIVLTNGKEFSLLPYDCSVINKKTWVIDCVSQIEIIDRKISSNYELVSQLIAICILSGDIGIPKYNLIESLWPDELLNPAVIEQRLSDLIQEAYSRKKVHIKQIGHRLYYKKNKNTKNTPWVTYHPDKSIKGLIFLLEHNQKTFSRKNIEKFLNVKRTFAGKLINRWKKEGLIQDDRKHYYYHVQTMELDNIF